MRVCDIQFRSKYFSEIKQCSQVAVVMIIQFISCVSDFDVEFFLFLFSFIHHNRNDIHSDAISAPYKTLSIDHILSRVTEIYIPYTMIVCSFLTRCNKKLYVCNYKKLWITIGFLYVSCIPNERFILILPVNRLVLNTHSNKSQMPLFSTLFLNE